MNALLFIPDNDSSIVIIEGDNGDLVMLHLRKLEYEMLKKSTLLPNEDKWFNHFTDQNIMALCTEAQSNARMYNKDYSAYDFEAELNKLKGE